MSEPTIKSLRDSLEHWQANTMFARQEANSQRAECDALRARVAKLEGVALDVAASLAAAISLLERGGKKAAPSDKMFEQMLVDYRNSLERARAALKDVPK